MHFDDRLATVLRHRAASEHAARTQFRQLLDLLGNRRHGRDESLLAAAWLRLAALGETIPAPDRAAMIREPSFRFRNPELAMHLAEDEPEVAAAALAVARLDESDWAALIPRLPVRARGFMRLRRDLPAGTKELLERLGIHDRGLPVPDSLEPAVIQAEPRGTTSRPGSSDEEGGSDARADRRMIRPRPLAANDEDTQERPDEDSAIGALVKRIEAFRRTRSAPRDEDPRLPLDEVNADPQSAVAGFSFTTDAEGRIDWADAAVAPMVVGSLVDAAQPGSRGHRRPLREVRVDLQGAPTIAGEWIVDAAPRFTDPGGHFQGYAGKFRRAPEQAGSAAAAPPTEGDRVRQLLHELRTPVNAIQGFAEVIQQQLFGPVPHEYRALAAGIASDAARMLAGFEELDRLARLESGILELDSGATDFARLVEGLAGQLDEVLRPRTAGFHVAFPAGTIKVPLARGEVETLAWRLLAALTGAVAAGEQLDIAISVEDARITMRCELPAALAARGDIFAAGTRGGGAVSAGMFGTGFALRLARAEARAADGNLAREDDDLVLTLPLLTVSAAEPSHHAQAEIG